jgi:sporadic carbohydrate cluster 2OG-Fe(II) oxygenase
MTSFLSHDEISFSKEFEKKGFIISDIRNKKLINEIRQLFLNSIKKKIKINSKKTKDDSLNNFHKKIEPKDLNNFRLKIINDVNKIDTLRKNYYEISKEYLNILLGNELAMQLRINLSIQLPNDNSSILPLHSDVWSGDSPYETVVWVPLVDCYKTKSMFILPPEKFKKLQNNIIKTKKNISIESIYNYIKKDLIWINIKFGQVLIFNQCLPHGNTVNQEKETRWSLNCRFKSIFSPYKDKKIGEFFEPITLRKISEIGIKYKYPKF